MEGQTEARMEGGQAQSNTGKIVGWYGSQDTQYLYASVEVEPKFTKFKPLKCNNKLFEDHSKLSCISSDLDKNISKVSIKSW